ncbi:MAG: hypothetical protein M1819_006369 [Sarea resinae]|nr:MAG: hypothetical protein M1819_006369 [Sarea resinae]
MARMKLICSVLVANAATMAAQLATEALEDEFNFGLYPRFTFGSIAQLPKRQAGGSCSEGQHSCLSVNITGCCPNDNYCYVNAQGEGKCCDDGSRCDDPCPISSYHCTVSATTSGTVSATTSCCARPCPAISAFQCPSAYGGGCCSVNSACLTDNSCTSTINSATVNTVSASATPTGCTNGQFSCPAAAGGGCCQIGLTCTNIASSLYCAGSPTATGGSATTTIRLGGGTGAGVATPTSPTSSPTHHPGGGLSDGAKAGLGFGIAVAGLLLYGALIWFIFYRRRQTRRDTVAAVPPDDEPPMSHLSPAEATSRGSDGADYFGPVARPGPFTHSEAGNASGMAPYYLAHQGPVPVTPQWAGDIATPVEIGDPEPREKELRRVELEDPSTEGLRLSSFDARSQNPSEVE